MRVLEIKDQRLLPWLQRELLTNWFPLPAAHYSTVPTDTYRSMVELAQDAVNYMNFTQLFAGDVREQLYEILQSKRIMLQNGLYLRAARPNVTTMQESVGWHRESMYGANEHEHNFWVPIHGVTASNAPRYIPGSDKIPDAQIYAKDRLGEIDRNVKSMKLGLVRHAYDISGSIDLNSAKPFDVPYGSAMVFPGTLIHGAAQNDTDQIRLSLDFRVVAKEHIKPGREEHYVDLLP